MLMQSSDNVLRQQVNNLFERQRGSAMRHKMADMLIGCRKGLSNLDDVKKTMHIETRSQEQYGADVSTLLPQAGEAQIRSPAT